MVNATQNTDAAKLFASLNGNAPATATSSAASTQDRFLKLLVTQMKNQDPLNPQDGTQYMTQLAQFSSLEQLTGINSKLNQLLDLGKK